MDVAFGGLVGVRHSAFTITETSGVPPTSPLVDLAIRRGAGLGGKALLIRRPLAVQSYHEAAGITHVYDRAVRHERLETVAALPVVVGSSPRVVVYVASRTRIAFGDRWFDSFQPTVRHIEREMAVEDEVRRRLEAIRAQSAHGHPAIDLQEAIDELNQLAAAVADPALRARFDAVLALLSGKPRPQHARVHLTPREVDVLTQVARGCSNQEAAANLGILPNTVKAYLKSASHKLHATNRVQAITAARRAGVIR